MTVATSGDESDPWSVRMSKFSRVGVMVLVTVFIFFTVLIHHFTAIPNKLDGRFN